MVFIELEKEEVLKEEVFNLKDIELKTTELSLKDSYDEFYFLEDTLTESLIGFLEGEKVFNIEEDLKLFYNLSYCQGDYFYFEGIIKNKKIKIQVISRGRGDYPDFSILEYKTYKGWSPEESLTEKQYKKAEEELENLKEDYFKVCSKLKKIGYDIIEEKQEEDILNGAFKRFLRINEIDSEGFQDEIWNYDYSTIEKEGYIKIAEDGDTSIKGLWIKPFNIKRTTKRRTEINADSVII